MNWISDSDPRTPGLYGALLLNDRGDHNCFGFAYWNGKGWYLPSQSDEVYAPARGRPTWCKLEIGTDWNGYD